MTQIDHVEITDKKIKKFDDAKVKAFEAARDKLGPNAILWSWNDSVADRHSPPVECCGDDCHPGWEIYAISRGGNLKVLVNDAKYEFFFGPPFAQ